MKNWIKFSFPLYYLFYSRLKRKSEQISWIIVFFMPVLFLSSGIGGYTLDVVFSQVILVFLFYSIYEIGYLENDAITIDIETNPTIRVTSVELYFIQRNFLILNFIRLGIFIFGLSLLYFFTIKQGLNINFTLLIILSILTRLFFKLHNTIRSRLNILTYFGLSILKYVIVPLAFCIDTDSSLKVIALAFLAFPLPRTIEHAVKVKYSLSILKRYIGELDTYRIKYYGLLLLVAFVINFFNKSFGVPLLYLSTYFFAYRLLSFFVIKTGKYKRSYIKAHDWRTKS